MTGIDSLTDRVAPDQCYRISRIICLYLVRHRNLQYQDRLPRHTPASEKAQHELQVHLEMHLRDSNDSRVGESSRLPFGAER